MLIKFSTGNCLSFKDPVTLDLTATRIEEFSDDNVIELEKIKLLKSAVIYGANASGKSNLLRAIGFMRFMVINSSKESQSNEEIDIQPFLFSTESENKPSLFEIVFLLDGVRYRYGFEVDKRRIQSEWLYFSPREADRKLFVREKDSFEINKNAFREGIGLEEKTRENALFLSVVSQFNGNLSKQILSWFQKLHSISGLSDENYAPFTVNLLRSQEKKKKLLEMLKSADYFIEDVTVDEFEMTSERLPDGIPESVRKEFLRKAAGKKFVAIDNAMHPKFDEKGEQIGLEPLAFDQESEGTKKYFFLSGPILDTLACGDILLVDEMDARLHPLLTRQIVKLFNSSKTNTNNAQLVFATHDTNLLSAKIFRRDQVWFTERNRIGATDLYSLIEYKVRNDASFEADYIRGRYGAIPYLGNFLELFAED